MDGLESSDSSRRSSAPSSRARVSAWGVATGRRRLQPLMVDDALYYLEQVRQQFVNNPEVYNNFLEVMKDFKTQA